MNETVVINKKAVKEVALASAKFYNKTELTRVSGDFVERANQALLKWIAAELENHPTDGKTIK
jgi:hypothetical protein